MNRSKQRGTAAETAVVNHLRLNGYPEAERRSLHGSTDKGDIVNGPPGTIIEVKAARTPNYQAWLREADTERDNAHTDHGIVVHKPHGLGTMSVNRWHVVMTFDTYLAMVKSCAP
jgi:hypothetical protein